MRRIAASAGASPRGTGPAGQEEDRAVRQRREDQAEDPAVEKKNMHSLTQGKKEMSFSSPGVLKQVWVTQGGKSQVTFGILIV